MVLDRQPLLDWAITFSNKETVFYQDSGPYCHSIHHLFWCIEIMNLKDAEVVSHHIIMEMYSLSALPKDHTGKLVGFFSMMLFE